MSEDILFDFLHSEIVNYCLNNNNKVGIVQLSTYEISY